MKAWWTGLVLGAGLILAARAGAQVAVSVRPEQENLLLFEPIRVTVTVRSASAQPVELAGQGEGSWLSFRVSDSSSRTLAALGGGVPEAPVRVEPGQAVRRTLDLLPRYDIRARGTYRIQAVVQVRDRAIMSSPATITILQGTELWSDTAAVPAGEDGEEQNRRYSLVSKLEREHAVLYACVRDLSHDLIYGVVRLGPYVPMASPQALVDGQGRLHVLFRHQPAALAYVSLDDRAQVVDRGAYSDLMSVPRLDLSEAGEVTVKGGLRLRPGQRAPGEADLLPPAQRPAPVKKRWWEFWKRSPAPPAP